MLSILDTQLWRMSSTPGAKPPAEETRAEAPRGSDSGVSLTDFEQVKRELTESKERSKRLNFAIRKLAAAIVTPAGFADKGQGRRNAIGQAIQELVKEFAFEEEE